VKAIEDGFFIISKGGWFARDIRVPVDAVESHTDERIDLHVTEDAVAHQEWEHMDDEAPMEDVAATTTSAVATRSDDSMISSASDDDAVRVPVVEEQLEATRHQVDRGSVRITSHVTEHEATLSVPVTEERVRVQRVAVDRPATARDLVGFDETVSVTVYGEEVDVTTQAHVVEEVVIAKEHVEEIREVTGTVTRTDVEVIDQTTAPVTLPSGETPRVRLSDQPDR
jgi:uncharacterized protein (TIGR02271 family)